MQPPFETSQPAGAAAEAEVDSPPEVVAASAPAETAARAGLDPVAESGAGPTGDRPAPTTVELNAGAENSISAQLSRAIAAAEARRLRRRPLEFVDKGSPAQRALDAIEKLCPPGTAPDGAEQPPAGPDPAQQCALADLSEQFGALAATYSQKSAAAAECAAAFSRRVDEISALTDVLAPAAGASRAPRRSNDRANAASGAPSAGAARKRDGAAPAKAGRPRGRVPSPSPAQSPSPSRADRKARTKPKRSFLRRWLRRCAVAIIAVPVIAFCIFEAAVAWWPYPPGLAASPAGATFIDDRNGMPLAAFVAADGQWRINAAYEDFSPDLVDAIVAVEDSRFFDHSGVDFQSAAFAAWQDLKSLRYARGASTITMQLVRLRDPRPRSLFNKFEQAVRARQIENTLDKRQILAEYLNRAPFGGNVVGAAAASWRYFGKSPRSLSLAQAALLAGLPQSPSRFQPDRFPAAALARRNHVLQRLFDCGKVDARRLADALAEPLDAAWRPLPQAHADALKFTDGALPALLALARERPGRHIRAAFDARAMDQCSRALRQALASLAPTVDSAAVVLVDNATAEVLASTSISPTARALDLARRPRSTGSTLKPFIYAAAFDAGIATPATILRDAPAAWPGYAPANYDRDFRGEMTAADALAQSRNIPALILLSQVHLDNAIALMQAAGLEGLARRPDRLGLSLAIGGAEAAPLELAEAYSALARKGVHLPLVLALDDISNSGASPAEKGAHAALLRPEICEETLACLSQELRTRAVSPEAAGRHIAWKTGTSSGRRDAWCAAVSRQFTLVVWMGNAGGEGSIDLVGAEAAAPVALGLLASIDTAAHLRPSAPWQSPFAADAPLPPATHPATAAPRPADPAKASPPRLVGPITKLAVISPAPNSTFIVDPDGKAASQQLLLRAAAPDGRRLWWFVDNHPFADSPANQPVYWPPTPGPHTIRVTDDRGHFATVTVTVR